MWQKSKEPSELWRTIIVQSGLQDSNLGILAVHHFRTRNDYKCGLELLKNNYLARSSSTIVDLDLTHVVYTCVLTVGFHSVITERKWMCAYFLKFCTFYANGRGTSCDIDTVISLF